MTPSSSVSPTSRRLTTANAKAGVRTAFAKAPAFGAPVCVAPGVWWATLPIKGPLNHVNVYLLEDEEGWTLVDTGSNTADCRWAIKLIFASPPFDRQVLRRVLVTHYHHDHIGLAGELASRGAELATTRDCWRIAQMLHESSTELPNAQQVAFARRAGLDGLHLAAYQRNPQRQYASEVLRLPNSFDELRDGAALTIGGRRWSVLVTGGHAQGHASLWSDDGYAITGDQLLAGIAPTVGAPASEPDSDPASAWRDSLRRLQGFVDDQLLCLPGHQPPFRGAATRCEQLLSGQQAALDRVLAGCARPTTALALLPALYRREVRPHEASLLLSECVGYLNHLYRRGLVRRIETPKGPYLWHAKRRPAPGARRDPAANLPNPHTPR